MRMDTARTIRRTVARGCRSCDRTFRTHIFSLSLFFPEHERGSRKRGDNGDSLRRPRGPPDDPVESGNSLNRIYWSVSRVLRGLGLLSFPLCASHPLFFFGSAMNANIWFRRAKNTAPTCIYTYLHTRIHTFDSFDRHNPFVICLCAKDNSLLIQWELHIAYIYFMKTLSI